MNARSPAAFMLSATIHALFAAAMFFVAYALKDEVIKPSKTFELVAGEGDNYAATEAPALGSPDGSKVEFPNLPPAPLPPAPAPPAPEPVVQAAPEPAPVQAVAPPKEVPPPVEPKKIPPKPKPEPSPVTKAEPKKPEPAVPDLKRSMQKVQNRMAAKQKAQRDKEAKAAAAALALATKQAEIARQKAALTQGGGGQTNVKKIDAKGIAQGVLGGSTNNTKGGAGGTALSREEQDLLEAYKKLLAIRLQDAHEKPFGLNENLKATAEIFLATDGSLQRPKIVQSSGSDEFDQSVLAAIRNTKPIGPRPDEKGGAFTLTFYMKDIP